MQLAGRIQQLIGANTYRFQITLDSFGIRHAFAGHSQERGSQDQHLLTEVDVLALERWVFDPHTLKPGVRKTASAQPLRLHFEHLDAQQVKTVVILEVRPRHRRLVLVTMYKTENG